MLRYSKDVNIYIESKSPLHEKKLPVIQKASAVYRHPSVARNLASDVMPAVTEDSLDNDYNEAIRLAEESIVHIYQIFNSKGYITQDEWDLITSSFGKSNYIFPDVSLQIGTTMKWQLDSKEADGFLRKVLSKHGIDVNIVPSTGGEYLYQDEAAFLKKLAEEMSVNLEFETIEKRIDSADYAKTKKRLHYMNLYDFLKLHFNIEKNPSCEEFVNILDNCQDKASANIISAKGMIEKISGDFWEEYEKYRNFKMIQVLARWYSKSSVRYLNGEIYKYFSEAIGEQMLLQAAVHLQVHTAYINPRHIKAKTSGTKAVFNFEIQNCCGEVYATVAEGEYNKKFQKNGKEIRLNSKETLELDGLKYGKTYCVVLWEVLGNDAAIIRELPKVTPGINWPTIKNFTKSPVDRVIQCRVEIEGGEGKLSYCGCIRKGTGKISSPSEGECYNLTLQGNVLEFSSKPLEYDEIYTVCVFALIDNGVYCQELIPCFQFIPKKLELVGVVRKANSGKTLYSEKEISLDFEERSWPAFFGEGILNFACRSDRYPMEPDDNDSKFSILTLDKDKYIKSGFKLTSKEKLVRSTILYICGWMERAGGNRQLIVKNCLYDIQYKVKKNTLLFDLKANGDLKKIEFPKLRIYCFDKKDEIVYSAKDVVIGSDYQHEMTPSGKIKYIVIEAQDPVERMMYRFRSAKTMECGKSKI